MKNKGKYPIDNSYSVCLSNPSDSTRLAGVYGELAKKVKIISQPFEINITSFGKPKIYEFIIVEFEGKQFMILNKFHNSYESMVASKNRMMDHRFRF